MSDIVQRAEDAIAIEFTNGHPWPGIRGVLRELVAELKSVRAENERLLGIINHISWPQ